MRKILHLPFPDKADVTVVRPVFLKATRRSDTDVSDSPRRLDTWRNEGGAERSKPLWTDLRVLVVEDEGMIAMAIGDILQQMGHTVCASAGTESDAVAASYRTNPDLIIIDGRLRIGSGIVAMREILSRRYVPHIYISGDSLVAETLDRGAVILRKPFSEEELADAIPRALAARTIHTTSGGDPESSAHGQS